MRLALLTVAALLSAAAASAQSIEVRDAYARSASPAARSGAVFMVLENTGAADDRLVAASAPVAERLELHTHIEDANGVMRMIEVEDGFPIPAGGSHTLTRGADHVMLMGLTGPLEQGATFPLTLVFERAGEIVVEVPVDSERMPAGHGGHGDHGDHSHAGH